MGTGLHSFVPPWYETTPVMGMILLLVKMPEREVALWWGAFEWGKRFLRVTVLLMKIRMLGITHWSEVPSSRLMQAQMICQSNPLPY